MKIPNSTIDPVRVWAAHVDDMETHEYNKADWVEWDVRMVSRQTIEGHRDLLSAEEAEKVEQLDARFRAIVISSLRESGLLWLYLKVGPEMPPEYWWWHVKES